MCSRFDTVSACNRQTDGQTDGLILAMMGVMPMSVKWTLNPILRRNVRVTSLSSLKLLKRHLKLLLLAVIYRTHVRQFMFSKFYRSLCDGVGGLV